MSPSKLNSLLTGVFVAMFIAMSNSALAQDGLRLWKPYNPESFGGARRSNDGMYGSVSGIYWSFSAPDGGYIGATTASGSDETRWVYDGRKVYAQTNSVKIDMMDSTTTLGTRFEVGNRRGHHGWLISGYGLPSQSHRINVQNVTMTIRDEGSLTLQSYVPSHYPAGWGGGLEIGGSVVFVWDRNHNTLADPTAAPNSQYYPFADWQAYDPSSMGAISGIGYLWGLFEHIYETDDGRVATVGLLAPLPIWFKNVDINVQSVHRSAEMMYTYRAHPYTWGTMELLAGARYWDFEDKYGFFGSGPLGPDGGTADNVVVNDRPVSILADMTVNARGENRVFGPQIGMKLSRQNARWTFGAEGRFMGGINAQSVKTEGYIASNSDYLTNYNMNGRASHAESENVAIVVPVGLQSNNTNFGHKQNKTYFSPILELRLSADWQWTQAVSFFGAFNTMYAGNIVRGVRVTDYVVHSDGTIFGIRGNDRNTNVMVYGAEAGIKINR